MAQLFARFKHISRKKTILIVTLIICFVLSMVFVQHNFALYKQPIAQVTKTKTVSKQNVTDHNHNKDTRYTQQIVAILKNGTKKGQQIYLTNDYSKSGAYDQQYHTGNNLFVTIDKQKHDHLTGGIQDVKRDVGITLIAWMFIFTILLAGGKKGLYSLISLAVNTVILSIALDIYVTYAHISLLWIASISIIIFTVLSLLILNGFKPKTYTAILATLVGTFSALAIAYIALHVTQQQGLRFEEMSFLTRPYQLVFMAGLFLGSLGGVMDVAITIATSLFSLYETKPDITITALKQSGREIGKDIMGTMTNILLLVYISGSIPMLILYLNNASPFTFTISMNLSLEIARALAGGIGIVLTIPITIYIAIMFIKRKKAKT